MEKRHASAVCNRVAAKRKRIAFRPFEQNRSTAMTSVACPLRPLIFALTAAALVASRAGGDERFTGPWNLADLKKPPRVTWVDKDGALRKLYYESEPFHGKPTRVFAYYAQPAKVEGKLPAMVLVHGGGGTAFSEWARLWARRGYIAIAM